MRGRLYSSCVRSSMLHENETWPVRKENVVALQRAEMRMVRWMCGVKLKDRLPSKELRYRWHSIDIAAKQAALVWACAAKRWWWLGEEMHGVWSWGSKAKRKTKVTWREVVREDCQACKLNKEEAMDRCKWRKVIKEVRWPGWVWAGECFFWYWPTWVVSDKRPLNGCCCSCTLRCSVSRLDVQ